MDRKQKKLKKTKKIVHVKKVEAWYKKHFLLEVLYYIPFTYYSVAKSLVLFVRKLSVNTINWVKSHSLNVQDSISDRFANVKLPSVDVLKFSIPNPEITLPEPPKINLPKINFDPSKYIKSELNALKLEVLDLFDMLKLGLKFVHKIALLEIKLPQIALPTIKLPEIKLPKREVKVIETKSLEAKKVKIPKRAVKAKKDPVNRILIGFINVMLWPFRTVLSIIMGIFRFEIRFRLFSFRTFLILFFLAGIYLGSAFYFIIWKDLPKIDSLARNEPRQTTTIYDRKGNVLYRLYNDEDRSLVPLSDIPQNIINATVAIEDADFFKHNGLSLKGIARAAKKTFFEDDLEGGSTITQQLVKNSLLTSERTYERKAKEAVIALEVERRYSKEQILEMYINRISYGGTAYGIKSAAKRYFNKDLKDLTLAESAYLAGLPVAPSKYSPFAGNLEAGKDRQKLVLDRMVTSGYISQDQASKALEEKLEFNSPNERIIAPHFVNYVISELENKYGQLMVAQGGLDVFTSIDMDVQAKLEEIVLRDVNKLKKNNVSNGAALITDPKTGEILAMVGSKDYWDTANDGNVNITITPRQPGSSIKPVTYSMALENGYSLNTVLDDEPATFKVPGQADYKPVNYDGKFHGHITLKTALANSYNIPAVKVLDKFGVDALVEHGKEMGITTWDDKSRFGLSLTLGAGEVKMTDMAVVYGVFANQGFKQELDPILKIYDSYGNVLEQNDCVDFKDEVPSILTRRALFETNAMAANDSSEAQTLEVNKCHQDKVMTEFSSYLITNILTDNRARTPAFGANSQLNVIKKQFAVKTGTTNDEKDNWAIGYNDNYVVLTWVGNNYNKPMKGLASGYVGSSTIWRDAVDYLIDTRSDIPDKISRPAGLIEVDVCPLTNTLACSGCPNVTQLFEKGTEPKTACDPDKIKEMLDKDDDDSDKNEDENTEEQTDTKQPQNKPKNQKKPQNFENTAD